MTPDREHGTPRGYGQHKRWGEPICDDCQEANREYHREWRAKKDAKTAASRRALLTLAGRHQDEYQELLAAERTNQQGAA